MSDDWLEIGEREGEGGHRLPAVVTIPNSPLERTRLVDKCWLNLSEPQRQFLVAWRKNRFNARAAERELGTDRRNHLNWQGDMNYATIARIWRGVAATAALDRDRLLARQDDIVETLLTPKPILHQGVPTGFEEVEAAAAGRNNEVLMRAAGMFPREGTEVNVGVAFAPPTVEVVNAAGTTDTVDAEFVEVSPALPEEDWLNEASTDSREVLPR